VVDSGSRVARLVALTLLFLITIFTPTSLPYPTGISGEVVASGCLCHGSGLVSEDVSIDVSGFPQSWEVSVEYEITITVQSTVTENGSALGGFNLFIDGGSLSVIDGTVQIVDGEATHTESGNMQRQWTVFWTAPSSTIGDIDYRVYSNTVDGDGTADSDDKGAVVAATIDGPVNDSPGAGEPNLIYPVLLGLVISMIIVNILPHGGGVLESRAEDE
ncbi:uncharacterized protein METZ01_LOCUS150385, partial [marine metagenome]